MLPDFYREVYNSNLLHIAVLALLSYLSFFFAMTISQCFTTEVLIYYIGLPSTCTLSQNVRVHNGVAPYY